MDVDLLVEGEQLQHGEVAVVDRAEVVAGELELGLRGQQEAVAVDVARLQRDGEVRARDREADADVAATLVAEARVDADVDRLAGVGEGPDPAADVDRLAVEGERVDRAHHPALGLLDVRGDRGLAERLGDRALEQLVGGLHPRPPFGLDRELEAARVLVELADQRMDLRRVEGRAVQRVEAGEDADVGRVAAEGRAARLGQLLDVVGPDVLRARLERDHVAQLLRGHGLGHDPDQRALAVRVGGQHAVDERRRSRRRAPRRRRAGRRRRRPRGRARAWAAARRAPPRARRR